MKTWNAYVQKNGMECSSFSTVEVAITDEQYEILIDMVNKDIPLNESAMRSTIEKAYCDDLDREEEEREKKKDKIKEEWIEEHKDDDDFDEDDFEFYYEENYEEESDMEWWVADFSLEDPNDELRLKKYFVGNSFPKWQGKEVNTFRFDENQLERIVYYRVDVCFDGKGTVMDVSIVKSDGLESEGLKSSSWGEAYPDYEFVREELMEALKNGCE